MGPVIRIIGCTILLAWMGVACSSTGESAWPNGSMQSSCAPWDGPAFLAVSTRSDGGYIRLVGFRSLSHAEGTWPIKIQGTVGDGGATLCPSNEAPALCLNGKSGSFTVSKGQADTYNVNFHSVFVNARGAQPVEVDGKFSAIQAEKNPSQVGAAQGTCS